MSNRNRGLREEIESHLRMAIRDRMERGESAAEAETNARREFGNLGLVEEVTREMWSWVWLEQPWRDVRYGLRGVCRNPGFTAVAVIALALGIGANSAIFAAVDGILLRPLSYRDPERLVVMLNHERGPVAPANLPIGKRNAAPSTAWARPSIGSPGKALGTARKRGHSATPGHSTGNGPFLQAG
jgi:hypothetical protein